MARGRRWPIRRRRLPDALRGPRETLDQTLAVLEPAKSALTRVVPSTRVPGVPLDQAALAFGDALERAAGQMQGWRHPAVEPIWRACDAGLAEAHRRALSLRERPRQPTGFEALIWAVEHLIDPLEPFADAVRAFDALRVRGG